MEIKRNGRHRGIMSRLVCLLPALALVAGLIAVLPGAGREAAAVDLGDNNCSLKIAPGGAEIADLAKANVVVDIYMVAKAVPVDGYDTYAYEFSSGYKAAEDIYNENRNNAEWRAMAQAAARHALENEQPVQKGVDVNKWNKGLGCGLYLLIARGADLDDYTTTVINEDKKEDIATVAYSEEYAYTFSPELVSLPGKEGVDASGKPVNTTAGNGEWIYDMEVTLKPEQKPRLGSLEIVKNLTTYNVNDPAVFVFQVEAKTGGNTVYSDVVTLTFTEAGQKKALLEKKIPVGAEVTVTEVYSGATYKITSDEIQNTKILNASDIASVSFSNDHTTTNHGGGGVNNHFTYDTQNGWQIDKQFANPSDGE